MLGGVPGWAEVAIILIIALLLFGKRLPGTMRSLGSSIVEFKKGIRGDDQDDDDTKETGDAGQRDESKSKA